MRVLSSAFRPFRGRLEASSSPASTVVRAIGDLEDRNMHLSGWIPSQ